MAGSSAEDTADQEARREAITRLLSSRRVRRQAELVSALAELGFKTTQASVSRDLQALAATKVGGRYRLPEFKSEVPPSVRGLIESTICAGDHLLVVRTRTGGAQSVAFAIDESEWPEVVGTIGGDDTIFVAVPDTAAGVRVQARLNRWADPGPEPGS